MQRQRFCFLELALPTVIECVGLVAMLLKMQIAIQAATTEAVVEGPKPFWSYNNIDRARICYKFGR